MKISIIATHPIQYQIPWYRQLAAQPNIDLKVFYAIIPDENQQGIGFHVPFQWDIPLLDGYDWTVLRNEARKPGVGDFFSCNAPTLDRELRRFSPDAGIITGWQSFYLLQALWYFMKMGKPRLVRGETTRLKHRKAWVKLIHRIFLRQYDAFLAIGKSNYEFYRHNGIPSIRIFKTPYFVDNERFRNQAEMLRNQRQQIRAVWQIPDNVTCFLYAGKLIHKKRIGDLISAMEALSESDLGIFLLIVGSGELIQNVKRRVKEKNLAATFTGFLNQTEIVRAYIAADCLCLPSDYGETWGLVVNESMACGRPAIVSDRVGCGPDLVENGVTGFVFPFGDIEALSGRMVEMASDRGKMEEMGKRARKLVLEHYSVEKAVEGTIKALDFVLKAKNRK